MSKNRRQPGYGDSEFEELEDLERRRASHQRWFNARRPKQIGNVIAQLVQRKGYAQVRAAGERDDAWRKSVGEPLIESTRVAGIRRGVFEVLVANSLMMQELTFRKEELLSDLQDLLPEEGIKQIRFRLGSTE